MDNDFRISITTETDQAIACVVENGLKSFNESQVGPDPTRPLWIVCRDKHDSIIGGLQGFVLWDWFMIVMLWVSDENRKQGLGTRLLGEAERAAYERGCTRAYLTTMTFQAPEFYKTFGYDEIARLEDFPPGHSYIWMSKKLSDPSQPDDLR